MFLIRECWQDVRRQELLVEVWVDLPVRWQLELVGGSSSFVKDLEGSNSLVVEFLLGLEKVEVGSVQPYMVSDLIVPHVALLFVVLSFHPPSGFFQHILGFLVDLGHVLCELGGSWVSERGGFEGVGRRVS